MLPLERSHHGADQYSTAKWEEDDLCVRLFNLMAVAWEGHCVTSASQGTLWSATRTADRQPAWV